MTKVKSVDLLSGKSRKQSCDYADCGESTHFILARRLVPAIHNPVSFMSKSKMLNFSMEMLFGKFNCQSFFVLTKVKDRYLG